MVLTNNAVLVLFAHYIGNQRVLAVEAERPNYLRDDIGTLLRWKLLAPTGDNQGLTVTPRGYQLITTMRDAMRTFPDN